MNHTDPVLLGALRVLHVVRRARGAYPPRHGPLRRLLPRARARHAAHVHAWTERTSAELSDFHPVTLRVAAQLLDFEVAGLPTHARPPLQAAQQLLLTLALARGHP